MILNTCILLLLINQVVCEDCVLDNGSRDLNEERKLNRDLLYNYDPYQSPQNITIITVRFLLRHFYFDVNEEIFTVYNWLFLKWVDERLQWDPKNYDGISETQLNKYSIWTPKLKQISNLAHEHFEQILSYNCQVYSSGQVVCVLQVLLNSECSTNLINWPYDIQSCSFKFGIYNNYKNKVVFTFNYTRGISMLGAEYGPGWNIIDFDKGENATSETQFYLTFVVERQGESLVSITIVPALVLSVLTVSSMFLDVGYTREGIIILSLLGHFYIQIFLNASIPNYSSTMPSILRFVIASFVITTFNFVFTLLLSSMRRKVLAPPLWVTSVKDIVFNSPTTFLIWPRWKAENLKFATDETRKSVEIWTSFANIINSASIVIVLAVYVSIFLSYMPKQMPVV